MPRGSAPGERRGGRAPGTPNKKTQEALLQQAMDQQASLNGKKKLAKDVLDEFMMLTAGMAAFYQPTAPGQPVNANQDETKFWKCVEMTRDFATALAKYQSPTFKALAVHTAPATPDRPAPLALPAPGTSNVTAIDDPNALVRVYKLRIGGVKG